ncbi:MAG: hypothetical protein IJ679_08140 [Lachnospiraceae bacterium]|nr:hypothetical protein [Lachnospiraceae bacterium]
MKKTMFFNNFILRFFLATTMACFMCSSTIFVQAAEPENGGSLAPAMDEATENAAQIGGVPSGTEEPSKEVAPEEVLADLTKSEGVASEDAAAKPEGVDSGGTAAKPEGVDSDGTAAKPEGVDSGGAAAESGSVGSGEAAESGSVVSDEAVNESGGVASEETVAEDKGVAFPELPEGIADEPETPKKTSWPANTQETIAEVFVEEAAAAASSNVPEVATELVDAPPIVPEGSAADNNIFGVEGCYYVTIPKHMAFRKLPNGDYETVESSRYTVNSGLDNEHRLSVRVAGINVDDTVQLSDATDSVHRKVEVSTMAYDVWNYRPDGTKLTVNEADALGYGKELVIEGPGKFFAKCRLSQFGDDHIHAGTWTGSILFTVLCTPEPEAAKVSEGVDSEEAGRIDEDIEDVDPDDVEDSDVDEETNEASEALNRPSPTQPVKASAPQPVAPQPASPTSVQGGESGQDLMIPIGEPSPDSVSDSIPQEEGTPETEASEPKPIVLDDGALIDISQIEPDTESTVSTESAAQPEQYVEGVTD